MDDLVAELQDFRHLRWDERTITSGTSGTFPEGAGRRGEGAPLLQALLLRQLPGHLRP